jgi:hypothetical protein
MFLTHAKHKEKLGYDLGSTQFQNAQKNSFEKINLNHNGI